MVAYPKHELIAGVPVLSRGDQGAPTLLVTGPPLGAALFRLVQERMAPRRTLAVELLRVEDPLASLQALVQETGAEVLVAHGLAVPLARRVRVRHIVCCNGPVTRLDPVSASLARLPTRVLTRTLRPGLAGRWLSSSAGLRRAVVNPYVMDRDIVVMLTQVALADPAGRRAAAEWLRGLPSLLAVTGVESSAISAIWGDHDPLYPLGEAQALGPGVHLQVIPGARYLHPEERPWELADRLAGLTVT